MKWKFGNVYQISCENIKHFLAGHRRSRKDTLGCGVGLLLLWGRFPGHILEICNGLGTKRGLCVVEWNNTKTVISCLFFGVFKMLMGFLWLNGKYQKFHFMCSKILIPYARFPRFDETNLVVCVGTRLFASV